jgi:hypothetical protein
MSRARILSVPAEASSFVNSTAFLKTIHYLIYFQLVMNATESSRPSPSIWPLQECDFPVTLWKKDSRFLSTDLYFWDTRFSDGAHTRRSVSGKSSDSRPDAASRSQELDDLKRIHPGLLDGQTPMEVGPGNPSGGSHFPEHRSCL